VAIGFPKSARGISCALNVGRKKTTSYQRQKKGKAGRKVGKEIGY
jgi:hypothetical protein